MATGIAWATIQDVEDLIGPIDPADTDKATRLLERATGIVASYICWPVVDIPIDSVPAPIREAVAVLAARALTGAAGGAGIASETIGGYSYRLAAPASAIDAMRITDDIASLLSGYRCGGGSASVVVCDRCGALGGADLCGCGSGASTGPLGASGRHPAPFAGTGLVLDPTVGRWWRESLPRGPHGVIPLV